MPIFGGLLVTKTNFSFDDFPKNLGAVSLEGIYMPSASRSATWYVSMGKEWRRFDARTEHDESGQVGQVPAEQ